MTSDSKNKAPQRAKKGQPAGNAIAGRKPSEALAPADATEQSQRAVDEVVSKGPSGALALAGMAVVIVLAIWIAFYFLVFLPRG
jgi:hypothetical protein